MDIGGIEIIDTGSRLLTAEDVAELTEHIERLQAANHEMWVRMTHMELHECPGCANVADLQEALEENAKLRKLARWMHQVMDESCAVRYPYEPAPVSMQAISRAEKELQALGIEVPS